MFYSIWLTSEHATWRHDLGSDAQNSSDKTSTFDIFQKLNFLPKNGTNESPIFLFSLACLSTQGNSSKARGAEAVFLVMCDLSMNKL